ncbi:MAG TPA: hypothetical protein VKT77_14740 [Chthonomonadaceae bacterium]|nr:hypothetical protein [Chthonomonadaceae bacterium]
MDRMPTRNWMLRLGLAALGAAIAFLAVRLEPALRAWAHGRPMLPIIMLLVGTALLNPRLRNQVIVGLCFGVAFLAVRDSYHTHLWSLPFASDRRLASALILAALLVIAALAIVAALVETAAPGSVAARRLYFGATALYCIGLGFRYWWPHGSLQSLVLWTTGLMALAACLVAHRIVAADAAERGRTAGADDLDQRRRDARHRAVLRGREWRDPAAAMESGQIRAATNTQSGT